MAMGVYTIFRARSWSFVLFVLDAAFLLCRGSFRTFGDARRQRTAKCWRSMSFLNLWLPLVMGQWGKYDFLKTRGWSGSHFWDNQAEMLKRSTMIRVAGGALNVEQMCQWKCGYQWLVPMDPAKWEVIYFQYSTILNTIHCWRLITAWPIATLLKTSM